MGLSQQKRILAYCAEHDGITSLDAVRDLGIMRLASRINDMRSSGIKITDEWVTMPNRFGDETRFKQYYITTEDKK